MADFTRRSFRVSGFNFNGGIIIPDFDTKDESTTKFECFAETFRMLYNQVVRNFPSPPLDNYYVYETRNRDELLDISRNIVYYSRIFISMTFGLRKRNCNELDCLHHIV